MKTTTFAKDVNRRINMFLSRVRFDQLNSESDVVLQLGNYLQKSGYDVLLDYELSSLVSLKTKKFPTIKKVDIMVKNTLDDEFFPIEVKYFRGINMTHQRRRSLMESYSIIQAMLHTYGIMDGGRTICITDNPYLSGDVRTARRLNIVRKKGTEYLQVPNYVCGPSSAYPKGIEWKEASKKSHFKYTSLKSEQIKEPQEDSLENADEVICGWHEQYKKKQKGEYVEFN